MVSGDPSFMGVVCPGWRLILGSLVCGVRTWVDDTTDKMASPWAACSLVAGVLAGGGGSRGYPARLAVGDTARW